MKATLFINVFSYKPLNPELEESPKKVDDAVSQSSEIDSLRHIALRCFKLGLWEYKYTAIDRGEGSLDRVNLLNKAEDYWNKKKQLV